MPQRQQIPFIGPSARSKSIKVNNQTTINLTNIAKDHGAKAPIVLESVPGAIDLGAMGNGPCRTPKLVNWKGDLYGVFGTQLMRISVTTGVALIGTLTSGATDRCVVARGRNYIMVVDGLEGYTWNGTTFAAVADPDFPSNPTHVTYLDGFFIVNDADTDDFYISAIEDPTSWNALDFEAASTAPDNSLALTTAISMLYILGDETTQLYYNTGNPDFPFELIQSATQQVGIGAPHSLADYDDGIFFLATTPKGGHFVCRMIGQARQIISTDDQDDIIHEAHELGGLEDAYGFIYKQHGHSYYVLQIAEELPTLVYNIAAGLWEERMIVDGTAWRAAGAGVLDGKNIIGSRLAARYYELDQGTYDDAGSDLVRRRVTQIYHSADHLLDWHEVVIECQAGVGNEDSPDPQIRLRHTNDAGVWSAQLLAPLGKAGEGNRRAVFRNLGIARAKQLEVECADAVPLTIISAYAVISVLED